MCTNFRIATALFISAAVLAVTTAAQQPASAHIAHVLDAFTDTPQQQGLLPTAMAEARIAAQHAALGAKSTSDLAALQLHAAHVLHAVDPTLTENKGPGLGYGLKKAVAAATHHIELAAKETGASANIKTHAAHVVASNTNVTRRADQLIDLGQRLRHAKTAAEAAPLMQQMAAIASQLVDGLDANKDGRVSWELGEGGLQQSRLHLELMRKAEGR